jgi:hypothetical protein
MENGYQNRNTHTQRAPKAGFIVEKTIQKRDGTSFTKLQLKLGDKFYILRENTFESKYPGSRILFNVYEDTFVPQNRQGNAEVAAPNFEEADVPMGNYPKPTMGASRAPTAPTAQPTQPAFGNGFGKRY